MNEMERQEMAAKSFIARNANDLDMTLQRVSFGSQSGVKNFIDEGNGAPIFSFVLENDSVTDHIVIIGGKNTIYGSSAAGVRRHKVEVAGVDTAVNLTDGTLVAGVGILTGLVARTDSSARTIEDFVNYLSANPATLLELKFESSIFATNAVETTNFNQQVKSVFTSPFHAPIVTNEISLRDYRDDRVQSAQYLAVPLKKKGMNVIVSDQNFLVLNIKRGTRLNVSIPVGAQMSNAQDLYRTNTRARRALAPIVANTADNCGC